MDSNTRHSKSTFPLAAKIILIFLAGVFVVLVGLLGYFIFNPNAADISSNFFRLFVQKKVEQIGQKLYLNAIQNPDSDNDGLTDIAEKKIFATSPYVADTHDIGMNDGQYVYNVYKKAFQSGDEISLASYRANIASYRNSLGTSTFAKDFLGVPSLDAFFSIRSLQTYNLYVGIDAGTKDIVSEALVARQNGDYQRSLDLLGSALQKDPNAAILKYHQALTYQDMKDYDKSLELYKSIENDPTVQSPLLYSDIATNYLAMGNKEAFVSYLQKSIREFPEDLFQYTKHAQFYKSKDDLDAAIATLNEGLKIEPRYAEYYNDLANIADLQGNVKEEFALYQKALSYDFMYSPAHENLAILYEQVFNDVKSSLIEARIAMDLEPTPTHVARVMYDYEELNQPVLSQQYETQLLAMKNLDATSYNYLGLKYLDLQSYTKAEEYFRKAIVADPKLPNPYNNLGITLYMTNRYDDAAASYKKAIELNPEYANAYSNLGVVYTEKKQYDIAIDTFKKAISLNPNLYRPYQDIAYVYSVLGDTVNARINYQKAVDHGDKDAAVISKLKELSH